MLPDNHGLIVAPKVKRERPKRKNMEERLADIFDGELHLSEFQKALVREKFLKPRITGEELGQIYGIGSQTINYHLRKPEVKKALTRLQVDIFSQIQALQVQALRNYSKYINHEGPLSEAEAKIQYMASRDLLAAPIASPASQPAGKRELPEFTGE